MLTSTGTVLLEPLRQTSTRLKKNDSMTLFKTLECGVEWLIADKDEIKHHSKFPTPNEISKRLYLCITLSVLLSPSRLDEQCLYFEGKIRQKQPNTEQYNTNILSTVLYKCLHLTIFLITVNHLKLQLTTKVLTHFMVKLNIWASLICCS